MTFRHLRHAHRTWLIEDGIPDVAQARRLGHTLNGIDDVYAHVADSINTRACSPPTKPAGTAPSAPVHI
ncbi:hypothetical protein [Streptomyces fractus]|uniref:hypothetical protein n=1 Tax=Streptomyces fractus TaxID=641806 RepID=UPI003CEE5A09